MIGNNVRKTFSLVAFVHMSAVLRSVATFTVRISNWRRVSRSHIRSTACAFLTHASAFDSPLAAGWMKDILIEARAFKVPVVGKHNLMPVDFYHHLHESVLRGQQIPRYQMYTLLQIHPVFN